MEASDCSKGQIARLVSPLLGRHSTCLVFYYHMYGATLDTLTVKLENKILWQVKGDHGQRWYKASVPLNSTVPFHVSFYFPFIYKMLLKGIQIPGVITKSRRQ